MSDAYYKKLRSTSLALENILSAMKQKKALNPVTSVPVKRQGVRQKHHVNAH